MSRVIKRQRETRCWESEKNFHDFFSEYLRILELEEKGSQKQLLELEVHDRVRRLAFLFSVKGKKYTSHKGWDTGLHRMPASLKSSLEGEQTERNSGGKMAIGQKEPHV